MCDTFIALPSATKNNSLIFGKNSDREPNEAQAIVRLLQDPSQAQAMANQARRQIEMNFSSKEMTAKTIKFYEQYSSR